MKLHPDLGEGLFCMCASLSAEIEESEDIKAALKMNSKNI
jgi:hypothetical protein